MEDKEEEGLRSLYPTKRIVSLQLTKGWTSLVQHFLVLQHPWSICSWWGGGGSKSHSWPMSSLCAHVLAQQTLYLGQDRGFEAPYSCLGGCFYDQDSSRGSKAARLEMHRGKSFMSNYRELQILHLLPTVIHPQENQGDSNLNSWGSFDSWWLSRWPHIHAFIYGHQQSYCHRRGTEPSIPTLPSAWAMELERSCLKKVWAICLNSRKPSMWMCYIAKRKLFSLWCHEYQLFLEDAVIILSARPSHTCTPGSRRVAHVQPHPWARSAWLTW